MPHTELQGFVSAWFGLVFALVQSLLAASLLERECLLCTTALYVRSMELALCTGVQSKEIAWVLRETLHIDLWKIFKPKDGGDCWNWLGACCCMRWLWTYVDKGGDVKGNFYWQLGGIQSQHWNTHPGISVRDSLDQFNWGTKTHPM